MSTWYGPKPKIELPKHPTPWVNYGVNLYDANDDYVLAVGMAYTSVEEDEELAEFIKDMINARAREENFPLPTVKYGRILRVNPEGYTGTYRYLYYRQVDSDLRILNPKHDAWIMSEWDSFEDMRAHQPDQEIEEIDIGLLPHSAPEL